MPGLLVLVSHFCVPLTQITENMKKIILLAFIGTLFATGNAFAHCGSCGVGDEAKEHKAECCAKEGKCCHDKKDCTAEEKAACKAKCEKACEGGEMAKCKEGCTKPCCAKEEAAPTASAEPPACCPASKAAKPA